MVNNYKKYYKKSRPTRTLESKRTTTPDAFPGKIKGSKDNYADGTKGIFVKSIKGRKGIKFIEKGVESAVEAFLSI